MRLRRPRPRRAAVTLAPARGGGAVAPGAETAEAVDDGDPGSGLAAHRFASIPILPRGAVPIGAPGDVHERAAELHARATIDRLDGRAAPAPAPTAAPPMVQRTSIVEAVGMMIAGGADRDDGGGLLVEDDTKTLTKGQMRRGDFFRALRAGIEQTTDTELRRAGRSADGCPFLARWLAYYEGQSAAHLERAMRKYAPESVNATRALDYLEPVTAKLGKGIARWAHTGEMPDVPLELGLEMLGGLGGTASGPIGEVAPPGSGVGRLLLAPHAGTEGRRGADADAMAARLGAGESLPGAVRARMEPAMGVGLAHVRVHADDAGASLSRDLGARAFTVGSHVAFGAGEFRPGDPAGDALLAHELAHVAQQTGGSSLDPVEPLEDDADRVAAGVVADLHRDRDPAAAVRARGRRPSVRGGLRLQRCKEKKPYLPSSKPEIDASSDALGAHVAAGMDRANHNHVMWKEGIYYATSVYSWCMQNDRDKWDDDYWDGLANDDYWDRLGRNQWRLKSGVSAAEGVQAWLRGFTIAECYTTVQALEADAIRAAVGDKRFDERFGSPTNDLDDKHRLTIGFNTPSIESFLKPTDVALKKTGIGTIGDRPAQIGEWYYFSNHPKFLLKHPASDWQGENSIYMGRDGDGKQIWSGLGSAVHGSRPTNFHVREDQMYDVMISAYNAPRNSLDRKKLDEIKDKFGGTLPPAYDEATPEALRYPDRIDVNRLLTDPPYQLPFDGKWRWGGFRGDVGKTLDVDKVKALRDQKGAP